MTDNNFNDQGPRQPPRPSPALTRLEKLVGTWNIRGRTLDSKEDNLSGRVTIEWLPGGFFLKQTGELNFMGFKVQSLELAGFDPSTQTFPSSVYSNMSGVVLQYHWNVQGNTVIHWMEAAKFTGTLARMARPSRAVGGRMKARKVEETQHTTRS
jgi:Protein of unknown function (DUF1579)